MPDTTQVSTAIAEMIRTGTPGRQLITAITTAFPERFCGNHDNSLSTLSRAETFSCWEYNCHRGGIPRYACV